MAKSRFVRVGGSAWEFKIDTKRLQDKKNTRFEEGSERRDPNKRQKDQDEAQKK